jgi:hypothetical protein
MIPMKHQVNKYKVAEDIALTISLILSVILVKFVMHLTGLETVRYDGIIFLCSCFVSIKAMYNLLKKLTKKFLAKRNIL